MTLGSPQVGWGDTQLVSLGLKFPQRQPWKQLLPIWQSALTVGMLVSISFQWYNYLATIFVHSSYDL